MNIRVRPVVRPVRVVVCLALLGTVQAAAAAPASAGGLGGLLSPSMGNGCAAQGDGTSARGATAASQGSTAGNQLGIPFAGPTNQCGGADLPGGFVQGGAGRNLLNIDLFGDQT